ncbi:MAG: radical SAM family heme chaperone HemW [Paludibacteraceae bacterium]|nr:radical SAM family heme chaperone HemW [Paludibacteraceae bacterium]
MAGIYVHIPFCKIRCAYCDFYSNTDLSYKDELVKCLCKELTQEKNYLEKEKIETIYFGGGTPSLLDEDDFKLIFDTMESHFDISSVQEITLEANPDDLSVSYIAMLRRLPFNRISIGIQSLIDKELRLINRRHSAQQALDAVAACRAAGFENISVDLIYGYPSQTIPEFIFSVGKMSAMDVTHISAYNLTYEEGTVLHQKLQRKEICAIDEETSIEMYKTLVNKLETNGFFQYEISNFAREGYESKHNSSYWRGKKYLGVGPSAHSYNGTTRKWNVASLKEYIQKINEDATAYELETLSDNDLYNEFIITGLRTKKGVSLQTLQEKFGGKMLDYCVENAAKYIINKCLYIENDYLKFTTEGVILSNGIMSDLLFVE